MSLASDLFDEPPTCAGKRCKKVLPEGCIRYCPGCQAKRKAARLVKKQKASETRTCAREDCESPALIGSLFCGKSCQMQEDNRTGNRLALWGGAKIVHQQRQERLKAERAG